MTRRTYRWGTLLTMFFAMLLPVTLLLVPQSTALIAPLLCPPGTTLERSESTFRGSTSINFACVDAEGRRTSADAAFAVVIIVLALLPFGFQLLANRISGGRLGRKRALSAAGVGAPSGEVAGASGGRLSDKLSQLQEAYSAGLMSREEYEKQRQAVFDAHTWS